jgi:hypothetical protein
MTWNGILKESWHIDTRSGDDDIHLQTNLHSFHFNNPEIRSAESMLQKTRAILQRIHHRQSSAAAAAQ